MKTLETRTLIIGGGISGLYMGYVLRNDFIVAEAQPMLQTSMLPTSYLHSKADLPTKLQEIEILKGCIYEGHLYDKANLVMMNNYAMKTIGKLSNNSVKFIDGKSSKGFVPENGQMSTIIKDLAYHIKDDIYYNMVLDKLNAKANLAHFDCKGETVIVKYKYLVSTIKLPLILKMLKEPYDATFDTDKVSVFVHDLGYHTGCYQVVYDCDCHSKVHRYYLMDNYLMVESKLELGSCDTHFEWIFGVTPCDFPGGIAYTSQIFIPIAYHERKALMRKLTDKYRIFGLGRFGVWDYKRFDHVIEDAHTIKKTMEELS